ncbi:anion permease [Legionella sp. W05-934-2]|uniref:anion permease n=1 Tax=Legionella sp. W05-934-2 TaxID=1198649 RepID=UPI003462B71E
MTFLETIVYNLLENKETISFYVPFLLTTCVILTGLGVFSTKRLMLIIVIISFFLPWEDCHRLWQGCLSSNVYFLMAILATSHIIKDSLLVKKGIYFVLYHLASKPKLVDKILFFTGIFLTPILTAQSARIAVMTPVLGSLFEHKIIRETPKAAEAMLHTTFCGCILLSTVFLSGKSSNYLLLNMLTNEQALPNGWLSWLFFASFTGLLLLAVFFFIHGHYYKPANYPTINRFTLLRSMANLPANSFQESTSLLMLACLLPGMLLMLCLGVSTIPLSIIIIFLPILTGVKPYQQLHTLINLPFICYLIAMVGTMNLINKLDVTLFDTTKYSLVTAWIKDPLYCMVGVFLLSWGLNFVLGTMTAPALAFTLLMPILPTSPVHPWIIIFTILMASEAWIFPYQSSYFNLFQSQIGSYRQCSLNRLIKSNVFMAFFKFLVLLASIPFWKAIGIYP